jgi:uncharacterized protein YggE
MHILKTAAAVGLALGLAAPARAQVDTRELVVTTGEAVVKQAADQVFVTFTAENRAKVPAEAQKLTATAMTGVLEQLKKAGVPADAIRTLQYDLQPEFDYHDGRQTLRGYVARNRVEVRVEPVTRAGEVIDVAVKSGASSVSSLRFEIKNRDALEREALAKAVTDARARAEAAAKGAGRSLDRVVRVDDQTVSDVPPQPRPYMAMRASAEAAGPPPPVEAGDVEIRARVTVTALLR